MCKCSNVKVNAYADKIMLSITGRVGIDSIMKALSRDADSIGRVIRNTLTIRELGCDYYEVSVDLVPFNHECKCMCCKVCK